MQLSEPRLVAVGVDFVPQSDEGVIEWFVEIHELDKAGYLNSF